LQAHVNEPALSVHAAFALQLCVFKVHSLLLLHTTPDPVQPALHAQVNEP
jgi:hypothetical protein